MTDILYGGINHSVTSEIIHAPHEIEQLLSAENVAFVIEQSFEEEVFLGREFYLFVAYDNLPIKGYSYPLSEVEEIHDLTRKVQTVNGETAICPDCGYVLTEFEGK